jgi:hypothetical protein
MNYQILDTVLSITDKNEQHRIMADYLDCVLFKNWFQRIFVKNEPEAYKIAKDIIFLQNNQSSSIISKHKFTSSTIRESIDLLIEGNLISRRESIDKIIKEHEKYLAVTFTLKSVESLIKAEKRHQTITFLLCIFTSVCALVGSIIGGLLSGK